jgi:uncharacterized membrane protein YtjA (UPF0391 family)
MCNFTLAERVPACSGSALVLRPVVQAEDFHMLRLALIFVIIALLAAVFGFGLVASMSYDVAKVLFFVFVVLAILSFIGGAFRSPRV